MTLITTPNLEAPDDFYEALIDSHRDLSNDQSHALNARLVLLLANHIGNLPVLKQALLAARASASAGSTAPATLAEAATASAPSTAPTAAPTTAPTTAPASTAAKKGA